MKYGCFFIGLGFLILMPFQSVIGQQTSFIKKNTADGMQFAYSWTVTESVAESVAESGAKSGAEGKKELSFVLSTEELENLPTSSAAYNPMLSQNFVRQSLLRYAKTVDPKIAKISIRQSGNTLKMQVSGSSQALIDEINNKLNQKYEEADAQYLYDNYYVPFKSERGNQAIKQDHKRYALESYEYLTPVVSAIKKQLDNPNNVREFINFALSWLQAIPYDTMEDRISSNGSGFAAPRELLLLNKGDCDSKSTLFLALLKAYNPNIGAKMILLPQHALVAVNLRPTKTDAIISEKSDIYVLAEPTGPAMHKLGIIDPSSQLSIRNRQFTSESF